MRSAIISKRRLAPIKIGLAVVTLLLLIAIIRIYIDMSSHSNSTALHNDILSTKIAMAPPSTDRWQSPFIFTLATFANRLLAHNWALSLMRLNIVDFKIYCADDDLFKYLSNHLPSHNFERLPNEIWKEFRVNDLEETSEFHKTFVYRSKEFKDLSCVRPLILEYLINVTIAQRGYNSVIYIDSDIALHKDMRPYLADNHATADIFFSNDAKAHDECWSKFCTCLVGVNIPFPRDIIRETLSIRYMKEWYTECQTTEQMCQAAAQNVWFGRETPLQYRNHTLRTDILDCDKFPSGDRYRTEKWRNEFLIDNKPTESIYWIHANFFRGSEKKIQFLKNNNAWYIDDSSQHKHKH